MITVMQKVFQHPNHTILVPHYFKPGVFVAPGHTPSEPREYMTSELLAMGCVEEQYPLWPRAGV